jgi:hypothetical protein
MAGSDDRSTSEDVPSLRRELSRTPKLLWRIARAIVKRNPGFVVVLIGLVVILSAFLVAVFHYSSAADVSTALAAVTGTVGAIVGAYFGVRVGSATGEEAMTNASIQLRISNHQLDQALEVAAQNQELAVHMAAAADPAQAQEILAALSTKTTGLKGADSSTDSPRPDDDADEASKSKPEIPNQTE